LADTPLYRKKKYLSYTVIVVLSLAAITYLRVQTQIYIYYHLILKTTGHLSLRITLIPSLPIASFYLQASPSVSPWIISRSNNTGAAAETPCRGPAQPAESPGAAHFLFNTLNTSTSSPARIPLTADLIEKLSSIMRYFLEQGPHQEIPLQVEMDFIRNYIELEKMRIRHPVKTTIEVDEDIANIKIPPMLLIPLVENVLSTGLIKEEKIIILP